MALGVVDAARQLIEAYAAIVDDPVRLSDWPELFADDAVYAVYTRESLRRGLQVAVMLDDSRSRRIDRVTTIQTLWRGHVDPQRPRHLISQPEISPTSVASATARTNFTVTITKTGAHVVTLAGCYEDVIGWVGGRAKFARRTVVLDSDVLASVIVHPL